MGNENQIITLLFEIQKQVSSISAELAEVKRRLEDGDEAISCSKTGLIRIEESIKNLPCRQEKPCGSEVSGESIASAVTEGVVVLKNSKVVQKIVWATIGAGTSLVLWLLDLAIKHIK